MKRIAIALSLLLVAAVAVAQEPPLVAMFADADATQSHALVPPFTEVTLYFVAHLDMQRVSAMLGAEFALTQTPANLGAPIGNATIDWIAPNRFGEILEGINVGWDEPQPGPIVVLGTMTVIDHGGYNFDGYAMTTIESICCGKLEILDHRGEEIEAAGGTLVLDAPNTASESVGWGAVKALY